MCDLNALSGIVDGKTVQLSQEEVKFILFLRSVQFGEIKLSVRDGNPRRVVTVQQVEKSYIFD